MPNPAAPTPHRRRPSALSRAAAAALALLVGLVSLLAMTPSPASANGHEEGPPEATRPAPRELSEEALTQAQALRQTLGFRSGREYVKKTFQRPAETGVVTGKGAYGLNLTPAELKAARGRPEVEARAADVRDHAERTAPGEYAGLYITGGGPNRVGMIQVQFKGDAEKHLPGLRRALPKHLRGNVAVRSVAYSMRELVDESERTSQAVTDLTQEGTVLSAAIDEKNNRIELGLADMSPDNQNAVRQRVGSQMVSFVQGAEGVPHGHESDESRDKAYDPIQGGLHIHDGNEWGCTSAFATTGYGYYFLTAGHCFEDGTSIFQGVGDSKREIGKSRVRVLGGDENIDASVVGHITIPMAGRFFLNYDKPSWPIHGTIKRDSDSVGDIVCMSGRMWPGDNSLQENCGTLDYKEARLNYNHEKWGVAPFTGYHFRRASGVRATSGDSGAPYVRNTWFGVRAVGIHSGTDGSGNMLYSHVPYALERFALTVNTDDW